MSTSPDGQQPDAPPGGFNLLRVMVIFIMMGCGSALIARRFEPDELQISRSIVSLREAAALVEQQAVAARPVLAKTAEDEDASAPEAAVVVEQTAPGQVRIEARDPRGQAARVLEGRYVASAGKAETPADLPRLTDEARARVLRSDPRWRRVVRDHTVLIGDVEGILVLEPGATLVLRDVVLRGSVLSSVVLDGTVGGADDAPEIVIEGSLRIDAAPELRGVAILAPTSRLRTGGPSTSVQVHGDVVVRAIDLPGAGSLFGHLATVSEPLLSPRVSLMADERLELPWSESLALPDSEPRYVAFTGQRPEWAELTAMTDFQFPESVR